MAIDRAKIFNRDPAQIVDPVFLCNEKSLAGNLGVRLVMRYWSISISFLIPPDVIGTVRIEVGDLICKAAIIQRKT